MGLGPGHWVSPSARSPGRWFPSCSLWVGSGARLAGRPKLSLPNYHLGNSPRSEPRCEPAFVWPVEQIAATWAAPFINFTQFLFSFLLEVTQEAEGLGG